MPRRPYGWLPSLPDHRDAAFAYSTALTAAIPASVDLRPELPPAYDQLTIGACAGNAVAAAVQFLLPEALPSRLWIYYQARALEGTTGSDSGCQLRDAIKAVATLGVPGEAAWPYVATPADGAGIFPAGSAPATRPPQSAYDAASAARAISYHSVSQSLRQIKGCLADGYPVPLGFSIFDSFYAADDTPLTDIPMPGGADDALDGGHAVLCVGYNDPTSRFIMRNSWGPTVQDAGHFYLPYPYLADARLAADFWTVRAVGPC